jgi:hypothetical protein
MIVDFPVGRTITVVSLFVSYLNKFELQDALSFLRPKVFLYVRNSYIKKLIRSDGEALKQEVAGKLPFLKKKKIFRLLLFIFSVP